jgi:hypothetical protein
MLQDWRVGTRNISWPQIRPNFFGSMAIEVERGDEAVSAATFRMML